MRVLPADAYYRIKAATKRLVKLCGGCEYAETRVGKTLLASYGSREKMDAFIAADVIADLEKEAGPIVTAELALLAGYALVPLSDAPATKDCQPDCPVRLGVAPVVAAGTFMRQAEEAIADGDLTPAELDALEKASADLELKARNLRDRIWHMRRETASKPHLVA